MSPCASAPSSRCVLLAALVALACGPPSVEGLPLDQRMKKYLIASFPDLKEVAYIKRNPVAETGWVPLVGAQVSKLVSPKALVCDAENQRLFVADPPAQKIYWYNIVVLSDGRIETDHKEHVAAVNYTAYDMSIDTVGNLYFSGKKVVPPPATTQDAIFKIAAVDLATAGPATPMEVWTRAVSGEPTPTLWQPSGIAVDAFSVYWGNSEKGTSNGALIRGNGMSRAKSLGMLTTAALVQNTEQVRDLSMTPQSIFYATTDGIFAIAKNKVGVSCGPNNVDCPLVSNVATDVQGMTFDGDGTIYVADNSLGAVYSFPSGSRAAHNLKKVSAAPGVWGLAVLGYDSAFSGAWRRTPAAAVLAVVLAAVAASPLANP